MRVAALYDVHGNLPALEAVVADERCRAADVIVCGGDLVAGPLPSECFDLLRGLGDRVRYVRGNGDRNVVERRPEYGAAWCADELRTERLWHIASWPLTLELDGAAGTTFCHATPRSDEEIVTLLTPDREVEEAIAVVQSHLVVCGHTHVQVDRRLPSGRRLVNAGSVGRPYERVPGAYWALVDDAGVELLRTEYDVEAAAASLGASGHPEAEEAAAHVLRSWDPDEVSATFEGLRGA